MIWNLVGWEPPTGHNGWLDLLLELGAAGLALVVVQVLIIFVNGIRAVVDGREPHIRYFIVTTLLILFYNLAESNLVRPDLMWILLVTSAAALAKIARQREAVEEPRASMRYRRGRPYAPPQGRRGITAS
jgi:O-antigen ligase